jgi:protein transport protein SEC31
MNMDDITSVGWNGQVSHILATSSTSGHTVVWDLRNRKEVMTLAYSGQSGGGISAGNRRGITTLAWHPDVVSIIPYATHLMLD